MANAVALAQRSEALGFRRILPRLRLRHRAHHHARGDRAAHRADRTRYVGDTHLAAPSLRGRAAGGDRQRRVGRPVPAGARPVAPTSHVDVRHRVAAAGRPHPRVPDDRAGAARRRVGEVPRRPLLGVRLPRRRPGRVAARAPRRAQATAVRALAGELADGAIPWLVPVDYLADTVMPAVTRGANAAGRPVPPVLASLPCVLSHDRDSVLELASARPRSTSAFPPTSTCSCRAGLLPDHAAAEQGWTPELVDAPVAWGDADALATRVARMARRGRRRVDRVTVRVRERPRRQPRRTPGGAR